MIYMLIENWANVDFQKKGVKGNGIHTGYYL